MAVFCRIPRRPNTLPTVTTYTWNVYETTQTLTVTETDYEKFNVYPATSSTEYTTWLDYYEYECWDGSYRETGETMPDPNGGTQWIEYEDPVWDEVSQSYIYGYEVPILVPVMEPDYSNNKTFSGEDTDCVPEGWKIINSSNYQVPDESTAVTVWKKSSTTPVSTIIAVTGTYSSGEHYYFDNKDYIYEYIPEQHYVVFNKGTELDNPVTSQDISYYPDKDVQYSEEDDKWYYYELVT